MKRFIKSKNGFTLIEIVIVVSIIVILSSATFVGINQVLDRANRNAQDLEEHHGAHFEEEAWATVKNLSVDVDSFKETSETSLTDPTESEETSSEVTSGSSVTPNEKDEEFLNRKQDLLDMGYKESEITIKYGPDGHIQSLSWKSSRRGFAGSGSGFESEGYMLDITDDPTVWANATMNFDEPVQSFVVVVPNGGGQPQMQGENGWMYDIKDLGNGKYQITLNTSNSATSPQTDLSLHLAPGSTIESFTPAKGA